MKKQKWILVVVSLLTFVCVTAWGDFLSEQISLLQKYFPDAGVTYKLPAPTPTPTPTPTIQKLPSAAAWMSEDEEVAWINSLGFVATKADLQASYAKFVVKTIDPNTNVLWNTESDDLRNYFKLYKRTGYAPFLTQAQNWRDFQVNTYSKWQNGGSNVIEQEHVYLMGLIDWYIEYKDQATLDAINRILDFVMQKVSSTAFTEQRVSARIIQCLAYYVEKINLRTDVKPKLLAFIDGVKAATPIQGVRTVKYYVGENMTLTGQPVGTDLNVLFPKNVGIKNDQGVFLISSPTTFTLKHFRCAASFQAVMLMHALSVAARVLNDATLLQMAISEVNGWQALTGFPWWDKSGAASNLIIPYNINADAPDLSMFMAPGGGSTPLYITQFAAFALDPSLKKSLQIQALLKQYGEYSKVVSTDLGKKPKYFPWQTWEQGYFLTQKPI